MFLRIAAFSLNYAETIWLSCRKILMTSLLNNKLRKKLLFSSLSTKSVKTVRRARSLILNVFLDHHRFSSRSVSHQLLHRFRSFSTTLFWSISCGKTKFFSLNTGSSIALIIRKNVKQQNHNRCKFCRVLKSQ